MEGTPAGSIFIWDFSSQHWWYTSAALFPNLYDFSIGSWIYYFPGTTQAGRYTSNPRSIDPLVFVVTLVV